MTSNQQTNASPEAARLISFYTRQIERELAIIEEYQQRGLSNYALTVITTSWQAVERYQRMINEIEALS